MPKQSSAARSSQFSIVHLFRTPVGGLFRHVCDLAQEQGRLGYDVGIICDSSTGGERAAEALARLTPSCSLGVHRLPIRRLPGLSDLRAARGIRRILGNLQPNVVHGHGAKGAAFGRILARRIDATAIYTPHGGSLHYSASSLAGFLYLGLERMLRRRTDGAIFESDYSARIFGEKVGPPDCPVRVIHNGIRDDEFVAAEDAAVEYDFLYVGELREIKGIQVFMEAISRVAKKASLSVAVVGDGELREAVARRIATESLENTVALLPPVYPAASIIRKARCVVVPSLAESLPYIVLETVAAGVPILATNVGGIPEIFGSNSGELLPPGDSGALADAMLRILREPQARNDLKVGLQEHARQNFKLTDMVQKTLEFYREVLRAGSKREGVAASRR